MDQSTQSRLQGKQVVLVPWSEDIIEKLPELANNRKIWMNLHDEFPHPYKMEHAVGWVKTSNQIENHGKNFAICLTGAQYREITGQDDVDPQKLYAIGGIGVKDARSLNERHALEFGYYIGEPFWGKGIGTEAVRLFTDYMLSDLFTAVNGGIPVERIEACIMAYNDRSGKVLQKNGFTLEAVEKKRYFKDGKFVDGLLYVKFRS